MLFALLVFLLMASLQLTNRLSCPKDCSGFFEANWSAQLIERVINERYAGDTLLKQNRSRGFKIYCFTIKKTKRNGSLWFQNCLLKVFH